MAASTKKPADSGQSANVEGSGDQPAPVTEAGKTTPPTETTTPTPDNPDPAQPGAGPTPAMGRRGDETAGNPNRVGEGDGSGPFRTAAAEFPSVVPATQSVTPVVPNPRQKMIDALVEEREGYARFEGTDQWDDRYKAKVADVDKSLSNLDTSYDQVKREREQAADRRAKGERDPNEVDPNRRMIDALLDEREGYVERQQAAERAGHDEAAQDAKQRVAAVDESLRRLGTDHETAAAERSGRQNRADQPSDPSRSRGQQTR